MKIFLSILFFSLFILFNQQQPCQYRLENGTKTSSDVIDPLDGINSIDEQKKTCYSFSHSDIHEGKCCYDSTSKKCLAEATGLECPKDSVIYNNCGMAGIYQPIINETCIEISLVQGYCCFAKFSDGSTACIRTKELEKEKNKVTSDMINYLEKIQAKNDSLKSINFEEVECKGYKLKYYMVYLIFSIIYFC